MQRSHGERIYSPFRLISNLVHVEIEMTRPRQVLAAVILMLLSHGLARADEEFELATVYFEQNATDEDAEVVVEATGGDTGLVTLQVVSPDGRTIINFKAPDSKLGIRHFTFESPEPENNGSLQADFPEGAYTFMGTTVTGVKLHSKAKLSHTLPATAAVLKPAPEATGVPTKGLVITWSPVKNLDAYIVVIEQEEMALKLTAKLTASGTTFAVPDGFLVPGTEYKLAIGTVMEEGNTSFVETIFTTAGKK
jgi:hypothetical protein